ncbi:helix-turn-helix protein [compost metagenome]
MFHKGWTRRQLAKSAGIGEVTAQQVCNGQRNPSPPVAKKIVDALGVEFEDIFELVPAGSSD